MGFLTNSFWGVRIFIWLFLLIAILIAVFIFLYWNREKIKELILKWRKPEKAIKISIIFPGGFYTVYWREIPQKDDKWEIDGKVYFYDATRLIRNKANKYPSQHFFYDNPVSIDYNHYTSEIKFSGNELDIYRENDLKRKLVNLDAEKMTMMMLMIMIGINLLGTIFIIAKIMGWLK